MISSAPKEIFIKCNVNLYGTGDQILIFAQSITTSQTIWRHQINELGKHFKCLTFDFVGVGKSDVRHIEAQRYIRLEKHLEDFLRIIDTLEIKTAQFIGHGLGAGVGVMAAQLRPTLFKTMHLIDFTPKFIRTPDFEGYYTSEDFEVVWKLLATDYLSWTSIQTQEQAAKKTLPEKLLGLYESLSLLRPDFAQAALRIKYDLDLRSALDAVNSQICFYHSLKEPCVPLWISEFFNERYPNGWVKILNSEGRHPQITSPDEVTEQLLQNIVKQVHYEQ